MDEPNNIRQNKMTIADLFRLIDQSFNEEEIRTICVELDIEYEDLPALGKENKIRELVLWSNRSGRIDDLVEICQKRRPNLEWPPVIENKNQMISGSIIGKSKPIPFQAILLISLIFFVIVGIVIAVNYLYGRDKKEPEALINNGTATAIAIIAQANGDDDNDGLSNSQELTEKTKSNDPDTDRDGLLDGQEVNQYGTDPNKRDSDDDLLSDGDEVEIYQTSPTNKDSDGDGIPDGAEIYAGSDPLVFRSQPDTDSSESIITDVPTIIVISSPTPTYTPTPTITPTSTTAPTATPTITPTSQPVPIVNTIRVESTSPGNGGSVIPGTTVMQMNIFYSANTTVKIRPDFVAFNSGDCSDSNPLDRQEPSVQDSEFGFEQFSTNGSRVTYHLTVPSALANFQNAQAISFLIRVYREGTGEVLVQDTNYSQRCFSISS